MALPILAGSQKFRFFFAPAFLIFCQFSNTSPLGSQVTVTPFPKGNNVITSVTSLVSPKPKDNSWASHWVLLWFDHKPVLIPQAAQRL